MTKVVSYQYLYLLYLTHSVLDEAPRAKRRKTTQSAPQDEPEVIDDQVYPDNNMDLGMDWGFGKKKNSMCLSACFLTYPVDNNGDMAMAVDDNGGFRHSSEVDPTSWLIGTGVDNIWIGTWTSASTLALCVHYRCQPWVRPR